MKLKEFYDKIKKKRFFLWSFWAKEKESQRYQDLKNNEFGPKALF